MGNRLKHRAAKKLKAARPPKPGKIKLLVDGVVVGTIKDLQLEFEDNDRPLNVIGYRMFQQDVYRGLNDDVRRGNYNIKPM